MNVSFRNGDTVMVAEKDAEYEDMKGWKIGTVMETKDDDNIVRDFANVRIRTEDNAVLVRHTSQIILLQRNESDQAVSNNGTRNNNTKSMCVPCCGNSTNLDEHRIRQLKFLCWRIGRMGGVQTLSDLLLSSSEKTLNEITLKVLVNLLKIPSNSSMLPRTSSGKAAFVPIMSRLLDPSATQRASAAEIVKLVLQSDIPHHTRNVAQIQQAGIQPLLVLLLKWIRLVEAENRRRRENRERVKAKRRRNIESETVSSQGCCAPSVSSKDTRTDAEQNRWHGAEYIRIGTWSRFSQNLTLHFRCSHINNTTQVNKEIECDIKL